MSDRMSDRNSFNRGRQSIGMSDRTAIEKHIKTQTFMFFVIIKASDLKGQLATNGLASIAKSFFC